MVFFDDFIRNTEENKKDGELSSEKVLHFIGN